MIRVLCLFNALKGHYISAQGSALCYRTSVDFGALKGRNKQVL